MFETNAWNRIPLEDYDLHMGHQNVAQSQLLNNLTKKYLQKYQPKSTLFLGISSGNGLEHIDTDITEMVCGVDINSSYLTTTRERFGDKIKQLLLVN
ncbi:hypothetical protein [Pedobacter xixiisoli]|uniref:Methyltransferase domain-containing protein n=1 Tax=Pedobacter xixiisoli TaxID=1476464 RepID=A0A285ZQM6_9SPHI|nr:hypothetical protein [Pedobacter xixiisoli]SOD11961.1 hypothetical protein SAMN06297358_0421 [Pedobacter xixiisoli]